MKKDERGMKAECNIPKPERFGMSHFILSLCCFQKIIDGNVRDLV